MNNQGCALIGVPTEVACDGRWRTMRTGRSCLYQYLHPAMGEEIGVGSQRRSPKGTLDMGKGTSTWKTTTDSHFKFQQNGCPGMDPLRN